MLASRVKRRGFSLIELVVVVVILGVIAAIALPRVSRGASGAADAGLAADLASLRNAISMYQAENGAYPTVADFVDQLTTFSDGSGNTNATPDTTYIYGPYLDAIPALKVGDEKGETTVAAAAAEGVAWVYNATTGRVVANASGSDVAGKAYSAY